MNPGQVVKKLFLIASIHVVLVEKNMHGDNKERIMSCFDLNLLALLEQKRSRKGILVICFSCMLVVGMYKVYRPVCWSLLPCIGILLFVLLVMLTLL